MPEPLDDQSLRTALYDATRTLKLPPPRGRLTEQERDMVANAIMALIKKCHWQVMANPDRGPGAMTAWLGNGKG